MKNKLRVLHVFGIMNIGGAETLIMNVFRNMDLEKVSFDFLVHGDENAFYNSEIIDMGGQIFNISKYVGSNHISYCEEVKNFFKKHVNDYDIVHCHIRSTANIILKYSKKYGYKTILHAHSISNGVGITSMIKNIFQKQATNYSDINIACSNDAGKWQFNNSPFTVIHNGIDIQKFNFSEVERSIIRNNLNSKNKKIFGHVGRFVPEKDHKRIIKLFSKFVSDNPNSELWLIGEGPLKEQIRDQVIELSLTDKVKFLGVKNNVGPYLCAMDVFMFLSKYEGLGISLIEAQCSGLPCLISEGIPSEAILNNDLVVRLNNSLSDHETVLCMNQLAIKKNDRNIAVQYIIENNYSIDQTKNEIESIYHSLIR